MFSLLVLFLASTDVVIQWNNALLDSIRSSRTPPPVATRALAMLHISIYDALQAVEDSCCHPYDPSTPTGLSGYNADDTASSAASFILEHLYPERKEIFRSLWQGDDGRSVALGRRIGAHVLASRAHDGSADSVSYEPGPSCSDWHPTLPVNTSPLLPQWPYVTPFGVETIVPFRPQASPDVNSPEFAAAYSEVFRLGRDSSTDRTPEETTIAFFWEDGAGSVTPPGHWQVIAQELSIGANLTRIENARLFALLSIAQADAAISAWDTKYAYNFFRPSQAIQENSCSVDLAEDPTWIPLIPTPPFPAFTSGHSTFSGASSRILELFFGRDDIAFSGTSPDPHRWPLLSQAHRSWSSLSEAAEEAGMSRIYGGIHWQFDNTEGLIGGREIANAVYAQVLLPR